MHSFSKYSVNNLIPVYTWQIGMVWLSCFFYAHLRYNDMIMMK